MDSSLNNQLLDLIKKCTDDNIDSSLIQIKDFISKGADVNFTDTDHNSLLFISVAYRLYNVIDVLIKAGADVNQKNLDGTSPLMIADIKIAEMLIIDSSMNKVGANVNSVDHKGMDALMHASMINNLELVKLLLKHSADPKHHDHDGNTALMHSMCKDIDPNIIISLLDAGADINAKNNKGETVLHLAVKDSTGSLEPRIIKRHRMMIQDLKAD
jgi:ankyrin repeat protein